MHLYTDYRLVVLVIDETEGTSKARRYQQWS
jgi:hypothetical protein